MLKFSYKELKEVNIKQNKCEISISDETFIFPIVNGMGKMIDELILGKEYRLIKRKGYYVVLDKEEEESAKPLFTNHKIEEYIGYVG